MIARPILSLGDELEAAVRGTPGVVNLYPAGPLVITVLRTSAHALGLRKDSSPILTEQDGDSLRVTVSIGVHATLSAPETAQAATQAITGVVVARGLPHPSIHLTVAHIAETPPVTEGCPA